MGVFKSAPFPKKNSVIPELKKNTFKKNILIMVLCIKVSLHYDLVFLQKSRDFLNKYKTFGINALHRYKVIIVIIIIHY